MRPESGKTYIFYDKTMFIMGVGTYREIEVFGQIHSQVESFPRCTNCGIDFEDVEAWVEIDKDLSHIKIFPCVRRKYG